MEKKEETIREKKVETKVYWHITNFNEGEMIFNKGDIGDCMYEVLGGSVGIYLHYKTAEEKLLAVRHAGDFFGEIALIEVIPRTAAAVALEDDTRLRVVGAKGALPYLQQKPDVLQVILNNMSMRIKQGRDLYLETCGVVAKYKAVVDAGEKPDAELSLQIEECLEMSDRYQKKLGAGL